MTRVSVLAGVCALLWGANSVAAAQTVYKCEMTNRDVGRFVSENFFFTLDGSKGVGSVYDGVIHAVHGGPIPAKITKRRDNIWRYKWGVKDVRTRSGVKIALRYSAILNTKTGKVSVSGTIGGVDNDIYGTGRCAVSNR